MEEAKLKLKNEIENFSSQYIKQKEQMVFNIIKEQKEKIDQNSDVKEFKVRIIIFK